MKLTLAEWLSKLDDRIDEEIAVLPEGPIRNHVLRLRRMAKTILQFANAYDSLMHRNRQFLAYGTVVRLHRLLEGVRDFLEQGKFARTIFSDLDPKKATRRRIPIGYHRRM